MADGEEDEPAAHDSKATCPGCGAASADAALSTTSASSHSRPDIRPPPVPNPSGNSYRSPSRSRSHHSHSYHGSSNFTEVNQNFVDQRTALDRAPAPCPVCTRSVLLPSGTPGWMSCACGVDIGQMEERMKRFALEEGGAGRGEEEIRDKEEAERGRGRRM
jgi:hypothetical protein